MPPPSMEASLHVTCGCTSDLKFILAKGSIPRKRSTSNLQSSGVVHEREADLSKLSMCCQTALRHPNIGLLNIEKYTSPPQATCHCFCVAFCCWHNW